jgi:hypothetical protein
MAEMYVVSLVSTDNTKRSDSLSAAAEVEANANIESTVNRKKRFIISFRNCLFSELPGRF